MSAISLDELAIDLGGAKITSLACSSRCTGKEILESSYYHLLTGGGTFIGTDAGRVMWLDPKSTAVRFGAFAVCLPAETFRASQRSHSDNSIQLERRPGRVEDIKPLSDPSVAICLKDGDIFAVRHSKAGIVVLPVAGIDARRKVQKIAVNKSSVHGDRLVLSTSSRKLLFFSVHITSDNRLSAKHFRALDVPDPPRCLAYNEETIAVGYKREYNLLRDVSGTESADAAIPVEVAGAKPGQGEPIIACIPLISSEPRGVSHTDADAAAAHSQHGPSEDGSCLLLTTENNLGVLVSGRGVPLGGIIEWDSEPSAIVYCFPFIMTLLRASNSLDVRSSLEPGQRILGEKLPKNFDARFLSSSGSQDPDHSTAYIASATRIFSISMRPRSEQISFLLKQFPPLTRTAQVVLLGQSGICTEEQLVNFHRVAGRLLFLWLQFDRALPHLLEARLPVHELLGMFPELRGKQRLDFNCSIFSPELTQAIAKGEMTPSDSVRFSANSAAQSVGSPAMFRDIVSSVFTARGRACTPKEVLMKVSESFRFVRTVLEHQRKEYGFPDGSSASQLADVALMRIFVMSDDADSMEAFLDAGSDVPIDEAAEVLEMYGLFECLAGLYLSRGLKFKALKLLEEVDLGTLKPSTAFDTSQLVSKALENECDLDLIGRFVPALLSSENSTQRDVGVRILCSPNRPEPLPTADILRLLEEQVPAHKDEIAQLYLEHAAKQHYPGQGDRLTQLALVYIRRVIGSREYLAQPASAEEAAIAATALDGKLALNPEYCKLLSLLGGPSTYDAAAVWDELHATSLLSAKVEVARARDAHDTAISICLDQLGDWQRAVDYCLLVQSSSGSDDAFVVLVAALFGESSTEEKNARKSFGLQVLRDHAAMIDCRKVLRKLPAATSVAKVHDFLCSSLVSQSFEAAETAVYKGLVGFSRLSSNCEMIQVHRKLQDRVVEVDQTGAVE